MKEILLLGAIMLALRLLEVGINKGIKQSSLTENTWDDLLFTGLKAIHEAISGIIPRKK